MTQPLWTPSKERIAQAQITHFIDYVKEHLADESYDSLYQWSIDQPNQFWQALWDYSDIICSQPPQNVTSHWPKFPGTQWFEGARFNFAENLLRTRSDELAIISHLENGQRTTLSFNELYLRVAGCAQGLKKLGLQPGDRVAGFLPNIADTVVAMLATTSLGAIWTSCSPDFGINGVLDRFGQIEPTVLFACDGYYYNGKTLDKRESIKNMCSQIDSIKQVIVVPVINASINDSAWININDFIKEHACEDVVFAQLPFDHPLYIMYSSGTTGAPKCIVHSAGGALLQHIKEHRLHVNVQAGDRFFYFTTCGWMMWNWLVTGLASNATLVLFDGSPFYPSPTSLIDLAEKEQIAIFGTSAKYIAALQAEEVKPIESHKLTHLRTLLSTGSPLSEESFRYVYRDIKADLCLSSISGGTDIISCFALGCDILPVYSGELQCRGLGMAVDIFDDQGRSLLEEKGELVCTQPFPVCPLYFWNDPKQERFLSAYFDQTFATQEPEHAIWAHGDFAEITAHGGVIIHGRSDAVLNPGGVRIGTAEIYRQVEKIDWVLNSICVGQTWQDDVRVVLFVVLKEGLTLDEGRIKVIKKTIRSETTPRHMPAKVIQVADIPRTISGKIVEIAVRQVIHNQPVNNKDALANPESLNLFSGLTELNN